MINKKLKPPKKGFNITKINFTWMISLEVCSLFWIYWQKGPDLYFSFGAIRGCSVLARPSLHSGPLDDLNERPF